MTNSTQSFVDDHTLLQDFLLINLLEECAPHACSNTQAYNSVCKRVNEERLFLTLLCHDDGYDYDPPQTGDKRFSQPLVWL